MKTTGVMLILLELPLSATATAQSLSREVQFDIPAQGLSEAVVDFSEQSGIQVVMDGEDVSKLSAPQIQGRLKISKTLEKLLSGTQLMYKFVGEDTVALVAPAALSSTATHLSVVELAQATKPSTTAQHTTPADSAINADSNSSQNPSSAPSADAEESSGPAEILVTATRRQTTVQDTPMSVSVLGSREVEQRGLVGMGGYLRSVPGVSVLDQAAGKTSIVMRGLAANAQTDEFHGPLVGVYFGEAPLAGLATAGSAADIKLVDVERIEVLRGPLGTLYGSSSLGGTVRNIPAAPNLQAFEGSFKAGASSSAGSVGAKRSFLDYRLRLNASIFQWKWEGVPIERVFDFCNATLNAGQAKSRGAEFDGTYYISDDFSVTLGGSYMNAELTEDAAFLGESSDRLPGAPKFNVHAGLQHGFMMGGRPSFVRGGSSSNRPSRQTRGADGLGRRPWYRERSRHIAHIPSPRCALPHLDARQYPRLG